ETSVSARPPTRLAARVRDEPRRQQTDAIATMVLVVCWRHSPSRAIGTMHRVDRAGSWRSIMAVERKEVGPRMSRVVVHGDTIYPAGWTADKSVGQSVAEQTKEILAAIDGLLAQAGTDKSHSHRRRDEQGVGRLGRAGGDAGTGLHRGAA